MHPNNRAKADYLRLDSSGWRGYDGAGITIAVWEDVLEDEHGKGSLDTIRQIAPRARVLGWPHPSYETSNSSLTPDSERRLTEFYEAHITEGVSLITLSKQHPHSGSLAELQRKILVERGRMTLFAAAGNDNEVIPWEIAAYYDTWLAVGAALLDADGKPARVPRSNKGPKLAFLMFEGWYNEQDVWFNGTSSAAPAAAAVTAKYHQYSKARTGCVPDRAETREFIRLNCEDLGDAGRDDLSGWGLFRLPETLKPSSPVFSDITGHWAETSILACAREGLLRGDPNGRFRPDDGVTRAELAAVLARLLKRNQV